MRSDASAGLHAGPLCVQPFLLPLLRHAGRQEHLLRQRAGKALISTLLPSHSISLSLQSRNLACTAAFPLFCLNLSLSVILICLICSLSVSNNTSASNWLFPLLQSLCFCCTLVGPLFCQLPGLISTFPLFCLVILMPCCSLVLQSFIMLCLYLCVNPVSFIHIFVFFMFWHDKVLCLAVFVYLYVCMCLWVCLYVCACFYAGVPLGTRGCNGAHERIPQCILQAGPRFPVLHGVPRACLPGGAGGRGPAAR